ncbi:MAG TPA: competence/damage-inducible protein A [Candidatus Evtepia faecavium]|nr:competence/damage-inducible protein A [Candidatus Evtepia faecavium]
MSHTAELIAVGTELLLGNIANTDAQMISQGLSQLGINVYYHTVVGDNPQRVRQAVDIARGRADILITTGGLGPTCDDLTKVAVAQAFGKELVYHEPSAQRIRERFAQRGTPVTENNFQQAMVPEGCTVLDNDWGTAPGVAFQADGTHVLMLPGPPRECAMMFRHRALPYLQKLSDGVIASRTVKTFGIGESAAEALLRDLMNALHNPTLAPYAKPTGTELRITAHAPTREEALRLIAPVEEQVKAILKDKVIGVDVDSLEEVCLRLLKDRGLTVGTAESCTGGLMAKLLTDLPGSSAVFRGGVVSYTDAVKRGLLGVPEDLLAQHGAVSPQVAQAMAQGARSALGCDLALAATGVAGPDPDDRGNPIGLVYLALAWEGGCQVVPFRAGTQAERERVRRMAAWTGLDLIRRHLTGLPLA